MFIREYHKQGGSQWEPLMSQTQNLLNHLIYYREDSLWLDKRQRWYYREADSVSTRTQESLDSGCHPPDGDRNFSNPRRCEQDA